MTIPTTVEKQLQEIESAVQAIRTYDEPEGVEKTYQEFNTAAFFDSIRESLFNGSLNQGQVDGHLLLGNVIVDAGLLPVLEHAAYILATVYHETARTMQPIEEYGGKNARYEPWYGRGYVQLTWEENYEKQQKKLGPPHLVHDDYNLALVPDTSALITVWGMRDGDFTGVGLRKYIYGDHVDYVNARRIVNGTDCAEQIAGYARKYEDALRIATNA